jgi:hypothetical protein
MGNHSQWPGAGAEACVKVISDLTAMDLFHLRFQVPKYRHFVT